jgi:hypothetical protein
MEWLSCYGFELLRQQRQHSDHEAAQLLWLCIVAATVQALSVGIIFAHSIIDDYSWLLGRLRIAGSEAIIRSKGW